MSQATHMHGHTLDLVITRAAENLVSNITVRGRVISDHNAVHFKVAVDKPSYIRKEIKYRKWKLVDDVDFSNDISKSSLVTAPTEHINDLAHQFRSVLGNLLTSMHRSSNGGGCQTTGPLVYR